MLPVYDKPTLQHLVEEAVSAGIDDILIITGRNKRSIEDHFDKSYELEYSLNRAGKDCDLKKIRKITYLADICYVRQKNLNGLGDAVKCFERHVGDEAFTLLLGHTITQNHTRQLMDAYDKYNTSVVSLKTVTADDAGRHKIISADNVEDNNYQIKENINNPLGNPPSNLAVMGRYILTPEIFEKIDETENMAGEIHLSDALVKLSCLYGVVCEGKSHYIENRLDWLKASIVFALEDDEFRDKLISYMESYI